MNRANLHAKHHRQIVCAVETVALAIILFEVAPKKSACSIQVAIFIPLESGENAFSLQAGPSPELNIVI
jgi:hypothetical protein